VLALPAAAQATIGSLVLTVIAGRYQPVELSRKDRFAGPSCATRVPW